VKKLVLVFAALALVACNPSAPDAGSAVDLEQPAQRGSYAQGYNIGTQGRGLPIEMDAFVAGIRDGMADSSQMTDEELESAMMEFQGMVTEAMDAEGENNRAAGEAFLAQNATREGVTETASGLQYEVVTEGTGAQPTEADVVTVHYRGTLLDGTEFDSSYSRNEPATFPLSGVIAGWTEGVALMSVGSTYKFYIPGDLAYGPNPRPGSPIGPNEMLTFEVELLGIEGQ
jgi:FKBP-type peptidyl-prolyl cis-trans isomerase FkpA/FKBP-type peptidyl-prolyl cis-trans isomerase FklB